MRRKFYGKPRPSKRQVQAALSFYSMGTDMPRQFSVNLTPSQIENIKTLVYADIKARQDAARHAISHGDDYVDETLNELVKAVESLNVATSEYVTRGG